jgi:hypothetical protein
MQAMLHKYLWDNENYIPFASAEALDDTFDIEWSDEDMANADEIDDFIFDEMDDYPGPAIAIADDNNFRTFDPVLTPDSLTESYYSATFGAFIKRASVVIDKYRLNKSEDR